MPQHPHRRRVVGGLTTAAVVGLGVTSSPVRAAEAQLSFLAIGDWGRRGGLRQKDVAAAMERTAARTGSRFILTVGDNFYPDGVESASDPHWKLSFEDVYVGAHLQTPWYAALGNHDYHGDPQGQLDFARTSSRWRMPSRYYRLGGDRLGFADLDLFCLDTTPLLAEFTERHQSRGGRPADLQAAAAQLEWLDRALAASSAPWKLVFGHHTIRSGGSGHGDTPEMVAGVLPILQRHRVPAYVCGHDHDLQHIVHDGLNYILTGAGSEARPVSAVTGTRFCAATPGFTGYRLTAERLSVSFIDLAGTTLYSTDIPRA